jgi:5-formyltetrahydrofolate cyclo-ligase
MSWKVSGSNSSPEASGLDLLVFSTAINLMASPTTLHQSKAALRQQLRGIPGGLSAAAKAEASRQICARLQSWPVFQNAQVIALYYPTVNEPDTLPLRGIPDKIFLFPLCHSDKSLSWHLPSGIGQWKRGAYGIVEPEPTLSPAQSPDAVDLVLVPGLAFTLGGARLGHGAGYYDRFLSQLKPHVVVAGICFSCQIQEVLPAEAHDIAMGHLFHA